MSHPVSRVLALLELLQARPGLTATQLAERLEVDERTVRRYAARLTELGIPVEAARGRYGGYQLLPGYKLPPLMLTGDEAVEVILGLLTNRGSELPSGGQPAQTALAKIQRVLPPELRERIAAVTRAVNVVQPTPQPDHPDTDTLLQLAEAAGRHRRVRLAYRSGRGADSEREVDPYGMVFHSRRWYVTGLDHRSEQVRVFRLDRIRAVEPRDTAFTPPADFDPVKQVLASLASTPYTHDVEVVLDTTLEEARRRIPPSIATLTDTADGILLHTRVERLDAMAVMLASLGCPFTIRHPDQLRTEVRSLAQKLTQWSD